MKIIFRTDASLLIGNGHVTRCLTLANQLKKYTSNISFIARKHDGHLNQIIRDNQFKVFELKNKKLKKSINKNKTYENWLGVSQNHDAIETIEIVNKMSIDWLIVDHYSLDKIWEKKIKPYVKKIMVIDDLANRKHICDILLDQNWFVNKEKRYKHLVNKECNMLLGPAFALLNSEFVNSRKKVKSRKKIKNVFIFFGGSDPYNLSSITLRALSDKLLSHLQVNIVIGANNPHMIKIKKLVSGRPNTSLHIQINNIEDLMVKSDLAIGSIGVNTWERICLGLYALTITFSENHKVLLSGLESTNFLSNIGNKCSVNIKIIKQEILKVIKNFNTIPSKNDIMSLVDGYGAKKVVNNIINKKLKILIVTDEDSWINEYIDSFITDLYNLNNDVRCVHKINDIKKGDICILLGCSQYMNKKNRQKNKNNIVVHESFLPKGKGWSPLSWQILEGKNIIPISLIEVEEKIDSGQIYSQSIMKFEGHELIDEMRKIQAKKSFDLCKSFILEYPKSISKGKKQKGKSSYYRQRIPSDSEIDINKTFSKNIDLLRIVDNERYPAFFKYKKNKYKIKVEKY